MHGKPIILTDFDHQERDLSMDMDHIHNYEQDAKEANYNPERLK